MGSRFFYACGAGSARNRRIVICAWLAATAIACGLAPSLLFSMGAPPMIIDGSPSERAGKALAQNLPVLGEEQILLVLHSTRLTVTDQNYRDTITAVGAALSRQRTG